MTPILHSQNNGDSLLVLADSLHKTKEYYTAIKNYEKAQTYFQHNNDWKQVNYCVNEIAYALANQHKTEAAIEHLKKSIELLKKNGANNNFDFAKTLILAAVNYKRKEDYGQSLSKYNQAISIYEALNIKHENVPYAYRNAAQIYMRRLDYEQAIAYFEKSLSADYSHLYRTATWAHLAHVNNQLGNYEKALEYCKMGLSQSGLGIRVKSNLLLFQATAYWKTGQAKMAIEKLKLSCQLKLEIGDSIALSHSYALIAEIYNDEHQKDEAIANARKSADMTRQLFPKKEESREAAKIYTQVGTLFLQYDQTDTALFFFQKAIGHLFPSFDGAGISENPPPGAIYTESWIMTAFARKGEALKKRYHEKGDVGDLKNAAECYHISLLEIEKLRKSYGSEKAKLFLGDYSHKYFEAAIETNFLLYEINADEQYLQAALHIMERAKAVVLQSAMQQNRAMILADIPAPLLEKEEELRHRIIDIEIQINSEPDEKQASKLRLEKLDKNREHETLIEQIKGEYPQFGKYVGEKQELDLDKLMAYLSKENTNFIEYFFGENFIYTIYFSQTGEADFFHSPTNDIKELANQFINYFKDSQNIVKDHEGFQETGLQLFQKIFPKKIWDDSAHKTIIVPDGLLNLVPFDALTVRETRVGGLSFEDYLIHKKQIRRHFSAKTLLQKKVDVRVNEQCLTILPMFKKHERRLQPLNGKMGKWGNVSNGKILEYKNALLAQFKYEAHKSKIILLHTHAKSDNDEYNTRIEFIDTALFLPELYAMKIPAELVVLSACETGLGKFEKGEGVMSLARGFAYAGTSNLISSLWQVNEQSTTDIFNAFYKKIREGKGKSEALREAKLEYLKNAKSDAKKSPYYWAGFVLIGDNEPIDLPKSKTPIWIWAGILGIAGIAYILWKKNQSGNSSIN